MKFNLKESNAKKIIELVYLGYYILELEGTNRDLKEYEVLAEKIVQEYVKNTRQMKARLRGLKQELAVKEIHQEVGDCMDTIHEKFYSTVESLEKNALPFAVSQALADLQYPIKEDSDSLLNNILIQEYYEDAIRKSGAGIIHLEIPDRETRIAELLSANVANKENYSAI